MKMKAAGLVLNILLLVGVNAAAEGNREIAERHFKTGVRLVEEEKFVGAAKEFEESLRLYPTKSALFNLVSTYKILYRYSEALVSAKRLLTEYGNQLDPETLATIASIKEELEPLVAWVTVEVEPEEEGARVFVDGREVETGALTEPIMMDPGRHLVRAELPGYASKEASLRLTEGERKAVRLALKPSGADAASAAGAIGKSCNIL